MNELNFELIWRQRGLVTQCFSNFFNEIRKIFLTFISDDEQNLAMEAGAIVTISIAAGGLINVLEKGEDAYSVRRVQEFARCYVSVRRTLTPWGPEGISEEVLSNIISKAYQVYLQYTDSGIPIDRPPNIDNYNWGG